MEEILLALNAVEPIGIGILIWRQIVADRERDKLLAHIKENGEYMEMLLGHLIGVDLKQGRGIGG